MNWRWYCAAGMLVWSIYNIIQAIEIEPFALDVQVAPRAHQRMNIALGVIGNQEQLLDIISYLKYDLEFTGQYTICIAHCEQQPSHETMRQMSHDGCPLAIFISCGADNQMFEWRLYETDPERFVIGKQYTKRGSAVRGWAHQVADMMWQALTGLPGFFSTRIAYSKEVKKGATHQRYICVADYDGSHEESLVTLPTICVAPCWNNNANHALIFYSEYTNTNVRLVSIDFKGKRSIASNFDGLNMSPAFSADGLQVVYCASRGTGMCQLYYAQKGIFRQLTNNGGNNISPVFCENCVVFCSDYEGKGPQIYSYDLQTKQITKLTSSGYCVSPAYCHTTGQLAYAKMVQGTMQIFAYDMKTKKHQQITSGPGNKEECCWSACGTYLIYSCRHDNTSRLCMLHVLSGQERFITPADSKCSYPSWSGQYHVFPALG